MPFWASLKCKNNGGNRKANRRANSSLSQFWRKLKVENQGKNMSRCSWTATRFIVNRGSYW